MARDTHVADREEAIANNEVFVSFGDSTNVKYALRRQGGMMTVGDVMRVARVSQGIPTKVQTVILHRQGVEPRQVQLNEVLEPGDHVEPLRPAGRKG
ncbi:hypothetical protein COT97_01165 [Candidatus Falkowbacteria bacterium CG10_big_fil_rev_8_21_14_0_10_39_11]|uniref:Soluble ligand binding domain-containing protein n=1 Tax=Candidatus Falkowbacteria bacterium CG10_big_fil_rev_8_21_14_0_10_39_11 TaxID=1974565 RepID=A0A2H0V5Q7_9BACT|nr:MAG: hypothetical protein COT97_01165 [Candidatus Falkowbacteria bacterium CG10_big_fil_rev_8_21_14_0_10_39_11]